MGRVVCICLMALLAACGSTPEKFYTLMPEARPVARAPSPAAADRIIVVGPITIPAALDQAQMVISKGGHEVDIRESERWASPLKDELTSALTARLGALLPEATVAAYHQSSGVDAAEAIAVDVSRFELGPGDRVTLDALWVIKRGEAAATRRGRTQVTIPTRGSGYERLAEAQGVALERLARALAAALSANDH